MPFLLNFSPGTLDGDTEVVLAGSVDLAIASAANTPQLIGINGGTHGLVIAIHNLSGVPVPFVHNSGSASAAHRKLLMNGFGGNWTLPAGKLVRAILIDPNSAGFPDAARGWYVDNRGQEAFARGVTTASTSGPTQNSSTPAVLAQMTLTKTTLGGDVRLEFDGSFELSADEGTLQFYVDNNPYGAARTIAHVGALASVTLCVAMGARVTALAAGSHTFDLRWAAQTGTLTAVGTQREMRLEESTP